MKSKIVRGNLVKCKKDEIYLWEKYNIEENQMGGSCQSHKNMSGIVLDVQPTKNTESYGWIAKVLMAQNQGNTTIGFTWCDLLIKVN